MEFLNQGASIFITIVIVVLSVVGALTIIDAIKTRKDESEEEEIQS